MPVAPIRRSTPGSTCRYNATLPDTTGLGKTADQYNEKVRPAEFDPAGPATVTSGPVPPPENVTGTLATAAVHPPEAVRRSLGRVSRIGLARRTLPSTAARGPLRCFGL